MTGLKLEVFFLISQKCLIKLGTMVLFTNQNKMTVPVNYSVFYLTLQDRKQIVTLNQQVPSWVIANARVLQESILHPLFFVYNNDLTDDLSSNTKLFADDTYLFSVIDDVENSELNNDLYQINKWAFQWKVNFNQNPSKQIQEIFFL